jgi:hypothetical protein
VWSVDTIKFALITSTVTPNINDSDPRWGAGGAQDYSAHEVTPGGNYATGGIALTSPTVTLSVPITYLNATSPIAFAADPSNPTGCAWGIFYDSSDAGKHAIGFMDVRDSLGAAISTTGGFAANLNGLYSGAQPVFKITAT